MAYAKTAIPIVLVADAFKATMTDAEVAEGEGAGVDVVIVTTDIRAAIKSERTIQSRW